MDFLAIQFSSLKNILRNLLLRFCRQVSPPMCAASKSHSWNTWRMLLHLGLATASSTPAPIEVSGRAAIAGRARERADGVRQRGNYGNGGRLKHLLDC